MLFWLEISAYGVFFNFDNERMHPPKYPSDPPPPPGFSFMTLIDTLYMSAVNTCAFQIQIFQVEKENAISRWHFMKSDRHGRLFL